MNKRFEREAPAYEEGTNTLRRIEFVARDREQIHAKVVYAGRDLADRLRRISVKEDTAVAGDTAAFPDRLDRAHLVVGIHDADEERVRRNGAAEVVRVDAAEAIDSKIRHPRAETLEKPARRKYRRMLNPRRDDVVA